MAKASEERSLYREALVNQYNLIFLAFFFILSLIMASFLPLVMALGLEVMYLALVPETNLFKAYVDNKYRALDEEALREAREERLSKLNPYQRRRYDVVDDLVAQTKENFAASQAEGLSRPMNEKLDTLIERFMRMMELLNVYEGYLNQVQPGELDRALREVERQLEGTTGRVQRTLQERASILEKRIERLAKVRENHTVVRTQIHTVEDIMRLIYESSITMQNPQGISQQLDDLLFDVESTEETVLELEGNADGYDDLSNFDRELEAALQEQPQVQTQQ